MIWDVTDDGHIILRVVAEGEAVRTARDDVGRLIANIVGDLAANGIEAVTDEMRFSISKTRPEVTATWRARVPAEAAGTVRTYITQLTAPPVLGEVVDDAPDQS